MGDGLSKPCRAHVTLAGTLAPFETASDLLARLSGLHISDSKVRTVTEAVGKDLSAREDASETVRPQPDHAWERFFRYSSDELCEEEKAERVVYLGVDAFSVPMQQPGGQQAEHRMLYLGTLYAQDKSVQRYLVDFDLSRLTARMRQSAVAWGLSRATRLVAITDGGAGIEAALKAAFDEGLLCILDWYHAAEYVHDYKRARFGGDERGEAWCHEALGMLHSKGGESLLVWLEEEPCSTSEEVRASLERLRVYLSNQGHRMDYPRYRSEGLDIGSGPTEAGCKLMGQRLKGVGMRWIEEGAFAIASLRALYESGKDMWEAWWEQTSGVA